MVPFSLPFVCARIDYATGFYQESLRGIQAASRTNARRRAFGTALKNR